MVAAGQSSLRMTLDMLPPNIVTVDDWKSVLEPDDRRRIQNRVNQRAARKRKRANARNEQLEGSNTSSSGQLRSSLVIQSKSEESLGRLKVQDPDLWHIFYSAMESVPSNRSKLINFAQSAPIGAADMQKLQRGFENWVSFLTGSPGRDCLFTLIQFNVFRAMACNERHLGLPIACALGDDAVSPLSGPSYVVQEMPAPLRPTTLQREIEHHPWIDLLPNPRMRDNLLRSADGYNEEELCTAILGCGTESGRTGMIVWGEAWDPSAWEFTEEFMHRWRWTLDGCEDSLVSTNYWRKQRGKKPLKFGG